MIRAEDVNPGSHIKTNKGVFTVRYCYYNHEQREITFDLERGKTTLSPHIDNTAMTITYGFDDTIFIDG